MMIRIGTRGSLLALTQSANIAKLVEKLGYKTKLVPIKTSGDQSHATSFGAIGPQGVFVKEIEQALLEHNVDMAVHSYKDLPTNSPEELVVAAVPKRLDAADMLAMRKEVVMDKDKNLSISPNTKVGTASARRQAWIKHFRPDITVEPIRGNVPTRIARLNDEFDGVILAAAGLERLKTSSLKDVNSKINLENVVLRRIPTDIFVPAPAQGALALQCRDSDIELRNVLKKLDDKCTRDCIHAERSLLALLEGGCDLAFGAYAEPNPSRKNTFILTSLLEHEGELLFSKTSGDDLINLAKTSYKTFKKKLR